VKTPQKTFLTILLSSALFSPNPAPAVAASPTLNLQSAVDQVTVGEELEVGIYLDTLGQEVVGVDAILNFDPKTLVVRRIEKGALFSNYPALTYENAKGIIKIAGSSNYDDYFSGQGILATIVFQAVGEGQSTLRFSWEEGATNDTNIVSPQRTDLLTSTPPTLEIKVNAGTEKITSTEESGTPKTTNSREGGSLLSPVALPGSPPVSIDSPEPSLLMGAIKKVLGKATHREGQTTESRATPKGPTTSKLPTANGVSPNLKMLFLSALLGALGGALLTIFLYSFYRKLGNENEIGV